jgi:hypothetical protein
MLMHLLVTKTGESGWSILMCPPLILPVSLPLPSLLLSTREQEVVVKARYVWVKPREVPTLQHNQLANAPRHAGIRATLAGSQILPGVAL